jgi:hypothetical protein
VDWWTSYLLDVITVKNTFAVIIEILYIIHALFYIPIISGYKVPALTINQITNPIYQVYET